ncbi:uncharacterized protein LOC132721188 [Ruditapes philippinarum]|uniref:uncharacterized protein LOC132721188 n=1 Tax=Ruditapes philippinarum TaxID=129788 RepID=UPI00295B3D16|nr:uncharacterized protein LOC132721188 [Ruditapes philippinarum]
MGKFHKERLFVSKISIYLLLMVVITELCHTLAEKHTDKQDTKTHRRRRRQAGDFILMNYKAQKALKGTTQPSEFFRRIGKKWAGPVNLNNRDILIRPDDYGGGMLIDDEYVENW